MKKEVEATAEEMAAAIRRGESTWSEAQRLLQAQLRGPHGEAYRHLGLYLYHLVHDRPTHH